MVGGHFVGIWRGGSLRQRGMSITVEVNLRRSIGDQETYQEISFKKFTYKLSDSPHHHSLALFLPYVCLFFGKCPYLYISSELKMEEDKNALSFIMQFKLKQI